MKVSELRHGQRVTWSTAIEPAYATVARWSMSGITLRTDDGFEELHPTDFTVDLAGLVANLTVVSHAGVLVPADGSACRVVHLVSLEDPAEIAQAIGAQWIEVVRTPAEHLVLLVDEEGRRLPGKPLNQHASRRLYPGPIAGDALILRLDGPELAGVDVTAVRDWLTLSGIDADHLRNLAPTTEGVSA